MRVERNLLSLTSALAVLAAFGLVVIVERLSAAAPGWRVATLTGVVAIALVVPLWATGGVLHDIRHDPWSEARSWLAAHAPAGSTIAVEPRGPYVDDDRYTVVPAWRGEESESAGADFYVASRFDFEPDPSGCKLFEVDAPWEGEAKRIVITKPC